jgi:lipoprotein signal peptidase
MFQRFRVTDLKLQNQALILVGAFSFLVDRIAKHYVSPSVLNSGVAFGIQIDTRLQILMWMIVIAGLIYWWWRGEWLLFPAILAAISNLIDRIHQGTVVDYLPVFGLWINLSDIVITGTVVLLILKLYAKPNHD